MSLFPLTELTTGTVISLILLPAGISAYVIAVPFAEPVQTLMTAPFLEEALIVRVSAPFEKLTPLALYPTAL